MSCELVQCLSALPPVDNGPSCVPARILGELAHCLPTLPPVDNRPWARTGTYTWASWRRITGVASCCQTALDMYLHTCFGELAQHLPALHPIDNRLQLVSVELAWRLPALHPVDTRPSCVPTPILGRACSPPIDIALLSTASHGCARIPGQAGASLPVLPPLHKQPCTFTCTHASVS